MLGVDDGIWSGNFNVADILFLIAAIVFAIATILPHTRRVDGARVEYGVSLVPLGLCLVSLAWMAL